MLIIPLLCVKLSCEVQNNHEKNASAASYAGDAGEDAGSAAVAAEQAETKEDAQQVFKVYRAGTGKVDTLSPNDYICGVVAAEISADCPVEALKAQAVAAFTYACYQRDYRLSHPRATAAIGGADLSDDYHQFDSYLSRDQVLASWGADASAKWDKIMAAVTSVSGKIVSWQGRPIDAEFFSVSSGKTESCADVWGNTLPYLVSVDSAWDTKSSDYLSRVSVSRDQAAEKLRDAVPGVSLGKDPSKWIDIVRRSAAGGAIEAKVGGKTVKGTALRQIFGLKSTNFSVDYQKNAFTFTVKGDGHGVGMSQYGACAMASSGAKWDEILRHYYQGTAISDYRWS